MLGQARSD